MSTAQPELKLYRGTWCLYWREDGKPVRRSLGTKDRTEARSIALAAEGAAKQAAAVTLTVAELWTRYRAHLGDRPAGKTMDSETKSVLPFFGGLLPGEINEARCQAYISKRRVQCRKDGTILTELNRLSATLGFALKRELIGRKPVMAFPRAPEPKDRYLTRDEARALLAAVKFPHVKLFVVLALTTAARSSAILGLTWDRVDLERRLLDLRQNDGRRMKGRAIVPINDTLFEALMGSTEKGQDGPVVRYGGGKLASIKKGVRGACQAAGLTGVSPHVFRHTAAVWMAEDEVPMQEIAQYLGHDSVKTTEKVYARFSPGYLSKAASSLNL